jgi:hypothetical protein
MAMTVVVSGGNLFALAGQYLNDATQWIRIAQANKISDPQLTGINTIVIPSINPSAAGGLAS